MLRWFWKNDQAIEAGFWVISIPVAWYFGWLDSVKYVSVLSVYALVKGCWTAHKAEQARREIADGRS